jgi:chromosome partitioning protein
MKRIAFVQQKGGAAKTTLCAHLAVAAEQDGRRTAIIDIDPQASVSNVWGGARGEKAPPVASVIAAELRGALEAARRALAQGQEVGEFDPSSKAAREIRALWREIDGLDAAKVEMVAKSWPRRRLPDV